MWFAETEQKRNSLIDLWKAPQHDTRETLIARKRRWSNDGDQEEVTQEKRRKRLHDDDEAEFKYVALAGHSRLCPKYIETHMGDLISVSVYVTSFFPANHPRQDLSDSTHPQTQVAHDFKPTLNSSMVQKQRPTHRSLELVLPGYCLRSWRRS